MIPFRVWLRVMGFVESLAPRLGLGHAAACSLLVLASCGRTPGPSIQFADAWHDFGSVVDGSAAEHDFEGRNTGDGTLEILSARTSCGCSVADISALMPDGSWRRGDLQRADRALDIPPGGTFRVRLRILSGLIRRGTDEKAGHVLLQTNDPNQPWVRLEFHVSVDRPWDLDPEDLLLGDLEPGVPVRHVLRIRPHAGRDAVVHLPAAWPPRLDLSLRDVAGGQDLVMDLRRDRSDPPGPFRIALNLPAVIDGQDAELPLILTGRILPLVDVRPGRLHFLSVPAGEPASAEVVLYAAAEIQPWNPGTPRIHRTVGVQQRNLDATLVEVRPGAEYLLRLEMKQSAETFTSGEVRLQAVLEGGGPLVIPYVGLVRKTTP